MQGCVALSKHVTCKCTMVHRPQSRFPYYSYNLTTPIEKTYPIRYLGTRWSRVNFTMKRQPGQKNILDIWIITSPFYVNTTSYIELFQQVKRWLSDRRGPYINATDCFKKVQTTGKRVEFGLRRKLTFWNEV
jgi:hypothetical protein